MRSIEAAVCRVSDADGRLVNATGRYRKPLSDLAGLYGYDDAFAAAATTNGDRVIYEVTEHRPSGEVGDLIFGVTCMVSGRIGAEFFLTRGHLHARADRSEIRRVERGRGVMLLETLDGAVRALPIGLNGVCYVPPFAIHRSVNVGDDDLVLSFAFPADAGQDYDVIARSGGMRAPVVDDGAGGWRLVDNEGWRARTAEERARLRATGDRDGAR